MKMGERGQKLSKNLWRHIWMTSYGDNVVQKLSHHHGSIALPWLDVLDQLRRRFPDFRARIELGSHFPRFLWPIPSCLERRSSARSFPDWNERERESRDSRSSTRPSWASVRRWSCEDPTKCRSLKEKMIEGLNEKTKF